MSGKLNIQVDWGITGGEDFLLKFSPGVFASLCCKSEWSTIHKFVQDYTKSKLSIMCRLRFYSTLHFLKLALWLITSVNLEIQYFSERENDLYVNYFSTKVSTHRTTERIILYGKNIISLITAICFCVVLNWHGDCTRNTVNVQYFHFWRHYLLPSITMIKNSNLFGGLSHRNVLSIWYFIGVCGLWYY